MAFLCVLAPFTVRPGGRDTDVCAMLPFAPRTLFVYEGVNRAWVSLLLALLWGLPALVADFGGPHDGGRIAARTAALVAIGVGGSGLSVWTGQRLKALRPRPLFHRSAGPAPPVASASRTFHAGRGLVGAIVKLDLLYLVRRDRWTLLLPVLALLAALYAALQARTPRDGWMLVVLLQGTAGLLTIHQLLVLFRKDADSVDALRTLPVPGRSIWAARWLAAFVLTALPGAAAALVLLARFGLGPEQSAALVAVLLTAPAAATLFANVGLALFMRHHLAQLYLGLAWILPAVLWFVVPPAGVMLLVLVLGWWTRTAPRSFDRGEFS